MHLLASIDRMLSGFLWPGTVSHGGTAFAQVGQGVTPVGLF